MNLVGKHYVFDIIVDEKSYGTKTFFLMRSSILISIKNFNGLLELGTLELLAFKTYLIQVQLSEIIPLKSLPFEMCLVFNILQWKFKIALHTTHQTLQKKVIANRYMELHLQWHMARFHYRKANFRALQLHEISKIHEYRTLR